MSSAETSWFTGRRSAGHLPSEGLFTVPDSEPWMKDGLCAQTDPEAFFPEKGGSTRSAKRVCRGCPVIDQCLDYALQHQVRYGIWGGLSERERRARSAAHPVTATCRLRDCDTEFLVVFGRKFCSPEHATEASRRRAAGRPV